MRSSMAREIMPRFPASTAWIDNVPVCSISASKRAHALDADAELGAVRHQYRVMTTTEL